MNILLAGLLAALLGVAASGEKTGTASRRPRVGVVQMSIGQTIAENCDRIVSWIGKAAARGARVVVFPEGALRGDGSDQPARVDQAVAAIGRAAKGHRVYVVCGLARSLPKGNRHVNSMFVVGPDGREVFRYDKLYDKHDAKMPGVFSIDGIPCGTMICADRWLRGVEEIPIQQGAQVSFELSCNFASEWVAPFQWYWYVPRALRNNVWVIFANAGNKVSGVSDTSDPRELRHGHSAIIAPDGRIVAAARDDAETLVLADVDTGQATRAEAQARARHPLLRPFWEAGVRLQSGEPADGPCLVPLKSAETDVTLAAAQVTGEISAIEAMIGEARAKGADLVAFPEQAVAETALARLEAAARRHRISVVVGMVHQVQKRRYNSACVLGPDGSILTRYDQLSAARPFEPGTDARAMWFCVKGVPAVVSIGRDALWTELAELAAVAGAQIHVHLENDPDRRSEANLRRLQVWSNMASFQTFTVAANVAQSAIWDDLRDLDERRAEVRGQPRPDSGPVEVYSPFSANLVVQAGDGPQLILATRHVGKKNEYHPRRTSNFNPQMDAWYRLGAAILHPQIGDPMP
jgi:predicted amidohydrolase